MTQRTHNENGYTLIEALIASAILAGVASVLAPAIHTSIKTSSRISQYGANAEEVRIADGVLAELFAAAVNPGGPDGALVFSGSPERLRFPALFDIEAGPQIVTLRIDDRKLIYAPAAVFDDDSIMSEVVLLGDASGFDYFGAENDRDAPGWRPNWTSPSPPRLIRIERIAADGSSHSLTFHISATAPIHCLFDQVSRKCRN